jgi:hypothetical protein
LFQRVHLLGEKKEKDGKYKLGHSPSSLHEFIFCLLLSIEIPIPSIHTFLISVQPLHTSINSVTLQVNTQLSISLKIINRTQAINGIH